MSLISIPVPLHSTILVTKVQKIGYIIQKGIQYKENDNKNNHKSITSYGR